MARPTIERVYVKDLQAGDMLADDLGIYVREDSTPYAVWFVVDGVVESETQGPGFVDVTVRPAWSDAAPGDPQVWGTRNVANTVLVMTGDPADLLN